MAADKNLVLNLNRPKYFHITDDLPDPPSLKSSLKRKQGGYTPMVGKRQKISFGQHFRLSSHLAKSKVPPKIPPNLNVINTQKTLMQTKYNSTKNDEIIKASFPVKPKESNSSAIKKSFKVPKKVVKFSFSTIVHDNKYSQSESSPSSSLHEKFNKEDEQKIKPKTSCLFTMNPEIPKIPSSDKSSLSETVFSGSSFKDLKIHSHLQGNLKNLGFESTTMVQELSIPPLLEGKDTLIKSQTGSGKTLAYAIPIIEKLMNKQPKVERKNGTHGLIIVPTRELAIQTFQWLEKLCKACVWIVPGYLIGGEKKKAEKSRLRKGINILVATPGRLLDHLDTTCSLSLQNVQFLILDEADRMLEMGYEKSITKIVHTLREQKSDGGAPVQTVLLSATLTSAVEKLAGISLNSPVVIDVTQQHMSREQTLSEEFLATPENLIQHYVIVPAKLRLVTLVAFILSKCPANSNGKMLIFMATQDMVDFHASLFSFLFTKFGGKTESYLEKRARRVLSGKDDRDAESDMKEEEKDQNHTSSHRPPTFLKLHGSMTQSERSAVFKSFSESPSGVLLCTDVAARGLDLPRVNWIVQYTAACTVTEYVHRVGRTARANTEGSALIFLAPSEASYISMLANHNIVLKQMEIEHILMYLTHPSLQTLLGICHNEEVAAIRLQLMFEGYVSQDQDMTQMAKAALASFIRSYAAYPKQAREIFCFQNLHLGHYAKSFTLTESPKGLSSGFRRENKKYKKAEKEHCFFAMKPPSSAISEFDSGLQPMGPRKKVKNKRKRPTKGP